MTHVVLSPHPDDAVLSCGGLIYRLIQRGEAVLVRTVMAGAIPPNLQMTSYIQDHLTRWQAHDDPVMLRRVEDQRAVEALGARIEFGDFPDLLYRTDAEGQPLYGDREAMFGVIHPADPALAQMEAITAGLANATQVYAPLGAGHHVDHQLVRDAAVQWMNAHPNVPVVFYEEYPYSAEAPDAVARAREILPFATAPELELLDEAAMQAKIEALKGYASQITTFWPDTDAMAAAVRDYADRVGQGQWAERVWRRVPVQSD